MTSASVMIPSWLFRYVDDLPRPSDTAKAERWYAERLSRISEGWCPVPVHGRLVERDGHPGWCERCREWHSTDGTYIHSTIRQQP